MVKLGELELEVVKEESITEANQITEKPVEKGANISDHIRQDPVKITFSAIVAGDAAESKYKQLEEMRNNQAVFDYQGEQRPEPYETMAIESVSLIRNPGISNGHEFGISLKQVRVVEQKTTAVKLGKDPVTGQQVGTEPSQTRNNNTKTQPVDQNCKVNK